MYGKPIEEMTVGELGAYLRNLDHTSGQNDPNGTKRAIRLELIRRDKLCEATGVSMEVLMRNPLIAAEVAEIEAERNSQEEV
jgi:hypothetical protein